VFSRKAGRAGGTKKANSGAGTRETWYIPVARISWLDTYEKQSLSGCDSGQPEQALPLKSLSDDFFEAVVLGSIPKISTRMNSILSSPTSMVITPPTP
jgi:hypothetical protein